MRGAVALVVAATWVVAGCGGGDKTAPASAPAPHGTAVAADVSPTATPGALYRYKLNGISALMPTGWKIDKQPKYHGVILGGPNKKGAVGFFVEESHYSAADYVDQIILNKRDAPNIDVLSRRRVKIPTVGSGVRLRLRYKPADPQDQLYASSIDGLLITITVSPGRLTRTQVNRILNSVERA